MNRRSLLREMIGACAFALLLVSAALAAYVRQNHQEGSTYPAPVPAARQLWTATGDVTYSSISPNGRFVAFVQSDRNQVRALMIHALVGGSDLAVTNAGSKGTPGRAVFSPDSKRLAFNWTNGGLDEIQVSDLTGGTPSAPRVLVRQNAETPGIWPGDWSSDGRWIAAIVLRQDRTGQIALISAEDGTIHPLKSMGFGHLWSFDSSYMYFSPDSRYLAYSRLDVDKFTSSAWLLAVDGTGERPAAVDGEDDRPAGWTSDGSRVMLIRNRKGVQGLWAQRVENGRPMGSPQSLVSNFEPNHMYSYLGASGDGDVYFSVAARETRTAIAAFDATSGTVSLMKEVPVAIQYDWSPDGLSLAYRTAKGPSDPSVRTLTIDSFGRRPTRVLHPRLLTWNWPRWSRDGRAFLVQGTDKNGRQGIYRVDSATAELQPIALAAAGEGLGFPQWLPDGRRVVYTRKTFNGDLPTAIVERQLTSGQQRILVETNGLSDECVLSPDGRFVAYIVRDPALKKAAIEIAAITTGERRELVTLERGASLGSWTPDSRSFVYSALAAASSSDGRPPMMETWIVSLDGGQPRRIELTDRLAQLARISPDGKQIAFVIPTQSPEQVWVIQDPLRRTARR